MNVHTSDMLNDSLKEVVYIRKHRRQLRKLSKTTQFNLNQVEALALIHKKICDERGPLTRFIFHDILHSTFDYTENTRNLLVDRVFSAGAKKNVLQLDMYQWVKELSVLLNGTLDERINCAYNVYDLLTTGKIKKEVIFSTMRGCLINMGPIEDCDEAVKDLIDLMIKFLDADQDGYINESDYKTTIENKNKLFLECMGPVFPARHKKEAFLTTFTNTFQDI